MAQTRTAFVWLHRAFKSSSSSSKTSAATAAVGVDIESKGIKTTELPYDGLIQVADAERDTVHDLIRSRDYLQLYQGDPNELSRIGSASDSAVTQKHPLVFYVFPVFEAVRWNVVVLFCYCCYCY
jgi:hypothetical protein